MNRMIFLIIGGLFLASNLVCGQENMDKDKVVQTGDKSLKGKFVPPKGRTLLLVGQDVGTIDEYLKLVDPAPAGFMIYTSTNYAQGLGESINLGGGECHAGRYTDDRKYDNTVLQLGLHMVDDLDAIIKGDRDSNIEKIGKWIKSANRPVYLRIGYEFDGDWNHYEPAPYIKAYRKIADKFRAMGADNISYVWASAGARPYKNHPISDWYPGDEYVDWVGISVFRQFDSSLGTVADIRRICEFAQSKNLPIGITEATPYGSKGGIPDGKWESWFRKVFDCIEEYDIRMFCYINTNWDVQLMWWGQGWGDCRIQKNEKIRESWLKETTKDRYLKSSEDLFKIIGYK